MFLYTNFRPKLYRTGCMTISALADWSPKQAMSCTLYTWSNKRMLTQSHDQFVYLGLTLHYNMIPNPLLLKLMRGKYLVRSRTVLICR